MHIVAYISAHGLGHLSQTAPALNELLRQSPGIQLTVRCGHPYEILEKRISVPFEHHRQALDFGMRMHTAIDVDVTDSIHAYRAAHADWDRAVAAEAAMLDTLGANLVLTNTPYLPLAAASSIGLTSVVLGSLNWADILNHYCGRDQSILGVYQQVRDAYRDVDLCIQTTPAMPMPWISNRATVGPVASLGRNRREELLEQAGFGPETRLVLVNFGGMADPLQSIENWPEQAGMSWIVSDTVRGERRDTVRISELAMPFLDVLCSCDALVTKPGYAIITEAACNGIPVLYVLRGDWPEEEGLVDWLHEHARAAPISRTELVAGDIAAELERLWQQPAPQRPACNGARQAADMILDLL